MDDDSRFIILGRISGVYGVSGWVRVYSFTDPRENILDYAEWQIRGEHGWERMQLSEGRRQGKGIVARLDGFNDRDQARTLMGRDIALLRSELPLLADDEYYWADLQGLRVINRDGLDFGTVASLMETGANDVLVVRGERERLIPLVFDQVVYNIDLDAGTMEVDWDPDF